MLAQPRAVNKRASVIFNRYASRFLNGIENFPRHNFLAGYHIGQHTAHARVVASADA
jgi:hypothetical protein